MSETWQGQSSDQTMSIHHPYNLGFTAASLCLDLARIVAEAYAATGAWKAAKERVLSQKTNIPSIFD